jgi:dienelactone hydrolase
MMGSFIEMPDGRGSAYLSIPAAGSGPGVLGLHAWWGLNQTFIDVCDLLSERGFLALAPDLFGDRVVAVTAAALVTFYGSRDGDYSAARTAYLGHFSPGDEWEPDDNVRALERDLKAQGREVTFHWYPGTRHWFFEPDRPEFDAAAASLAWDRTVAFFEARLESGRVGDSG